MDEADNCHGQHFQPEMAQYIAIWVVLLKKLITYCTYGPLVSGKILSVQATGKIKSFIRNSYAKKQTGDTPEYAQ